MKLLGTVNAQPIPKTPNPRQTLHFGLCGQVDAADFQPWIQNHAHKLGVTFAVTKADEGEIWIDAQGTAEMLDAFALACSLGPRSVFIESVLFADASNTATSGANLSNQKEATQP